MADVNNDDETTLDQSNSGESDDQTDDSVANQSGNDQEAGNAADGNSGDEGSNDDAEGERKPRGEVRHERYIDKLATEIRASNDQSSRYTEEIFTPKPYTPLKFEEGAEYDPEQLEKDRQTVVQNSRAEGIQQGLNQGTSQVVKELWADRFDVDGDRVAAKWTELNPESDNYNAKLEATLVQKYIAFTGVEKDTRNRITIQKPNIRFKDFVEAEMQNLEDYASHHRETSNKNIERQSAQRGVRPTGQSRSSKGDNGFDPNDPVGSVARMTSEQYFKLGGREASDAYLAKRGIGAKN